ncbi:MAG: NTP transferase domain-containing protein [bacterium]|nr:MAG: NTP transferase domain-containing protein [bacterium]
MSEDTINALIVSAGYSQRMGTFKPLLEYKNLPFILNVVLKTYQICDQIFIVTGYRADYLKKKINNLLSREPRTEWLHKHQFSLNNWQCLSQKIHFIHNPDFQLGMFSSLQQGLRQMKIATWTLYHFVDQPHLPVSFYQEFSRQVSPNIKWLQPRFKKRNGHPIILHSSLTDQITAANINENLNSLFKKIQITKEFWDCSYPEVLQDFDTLRDFDNGGKIDDSHPKST